MLHINTLPDDCLWLILKQLPLRELFRLRTTICSRWFTLIEQMFLTYRHLHLFASHHELATVNRSLFEHNIDNFSFDSLVLIMNATEPDGIDPRACLLLPELFPNVRKLKFCNRETREDKIPLMLEKWAPTLNFLCMTAMPKAAESIEQLWNVIGQMSQLEIFKLLCAYRNAIPEDLPILGQLKGLHLMYYLPNLVPILKQLTSCQELMLNWIYLSESQLDEILQCNAGLRDLKNLTLGFIFSPNGCREKNFQNLFAYICQNMRQLRMLDIMFADHLPLSTLIPHLSHLNQLNTLWLYIGRNQLDRPTPYHLPPLTTVTTLKLEIFDLTVDQFFIWIPYLFPALESLTLRCPDFNDERQRQLEARISRELPELKRRKLKFV